jgi:sugar phosphate isomerase/epimerase
MRLGCVVSAKDDADLSAKLTACRRAGLSAVQINSAAISSPEFLSAAVSSCQREEIELAALGAYANPLQTDSESSSALSSDDLAKLIENLPPAPASSPWRIVTWSGTLSGQLLTPHPGNQAPGALSEVIAWTKSFLPLLEKSNAQLLFKPHHAHILYNSDTIEEFFGEVDSESVGLAMDPCGFLAPRNFHERETLIEKALKYLGDYSQIVHIRDARIENFQIALCAPGQGQMGFAGLLKQLHKRCPDAPCLLDGVESELTLKRSREFIELQAKLAGL